MKGLQEIPEGKGMRAFYQDSAANRLIFAPTGFAMEPGELHVTDTELLFVTASYGLNDYLSFWAGISPLGAVATALVSENWLIWGERVQGEGWDAVPLAGFFALAFRIAGNRFSWDIGVIAPLGFDGGATGLFGGQFVPLPWLSVTYRIR